MRVTRVLGPVAAGLLAATGLLLTPAQPAHASAHSAASNACPGASGVTVVVDFNELPAGAEHQVGCDPDASGRAVDHFRRAGFTLTEHATQQGYTCQVNGQPADRDCLANDAFWSLWWSDGKSGEWVFSTSGVTSLRVPAGGYVAFAWHEGSGKAAPPDVAPTPRVATATPTTSPTKDSGSTGGTGGSTGGKGDKGGDKGGDEDTPTDPSTSATPSGTASASASPTGKSSGTATASPTDASSSAVPGAEDITAGPETDDVAHTDDESGPFPTWALVGLGVGVLGAAGAVPLIRRRLG
ncbi:hypothetical protein CFH99_17830 [Nocardioides aromaticivorans]|uniref:Uncharacterized protein n=1 Tax=Nocardioides aromaticivorans TaxID=200618 RepID=A0ABX7PNG5_9ACTN|nr:hypothetical protein CFH99_17830 [Nocardioides aromaticivorans]